MNKKKLFVLLPAALLALSGCNPSDNPDKPSSEDHSQASQVVSSDQGEKPSSEKPSSSEEPVKTYAVTITQVEHANVTADKTEAKAGESVTFTVTTDEDYHVSSFKVNGAEVELTNGTATVTMTENGLAVTITVEANTHDVTIHSSENGKVTADKATAIVGDKVTFTITPNDDFELDTFKINGETKTVTGNTFEATMVKTGLTVDATFKAMKHAVTINKNIGGTVTADKAEAATGEDVTLTVVPDENYHLSALYVNGEAVSVGENNTAVVKMTKTGLTVSGVFAKKSASVTVIDTKGGTLYADPATSAQIGESVFITIEPEDGYTIEKLLVNGEEVEVQEDSHGYFAEVDMVEGGLTITAVWKELAKTITITPSENGTVTANKEKAAVGESVIFTISPAEGYHLESFKVNGTEVEVTGTTYTATMTEAGLSIEATFSDTYRVTSISESLKTTVQGLDTAKVTLTADSTVDTLPLAKTNTIIDLGGKTLTVSSARVATAKAGETGAHVQNITIKNGTINVTGAAANGNLIDASDALSFTLDGVTLTNTTPTFTGIYCSASTDLEIKNSTLNLKAVYGIGTNNLEGKNAKIVMENSHLTVTSEDKDNTAFLGNVEGINVTIKNSTLKADRQALIARTGSWKIDGTTFETTGAWLEDAGHKTKNDSYLAGTWDIGNEVPSAAAVIGDNVGGAYNEDVNVTFTNSSKFIAPAGSKIVSRVDGTHATTINADALTYVNAYGSMDNGTGVNVIAKNVLTKTIAEMNALTTNDDKNLYAVTGILKEITNASYGNGYLEDPTTGETVMLYGSYSEATILMSDAGVFSLKKTTGSKPIVDGTALSKTNIGRMVTVFGTYQNFNGTSEITNSLAIPFGEAKNDITATIEVNDSSMGAATLSKTSNIKYGEVITVVTNPAEGYSLASAFVEDIRGNKTNITDSLSFEAGLVNKVTITFEKTKVLEEHVTEISFEAADKTSKDGLVVLNKGIFTFKMSNGRVDSSLVFKGFRNSYLTVSAEGAKITKIIFTFGADEAVKGGSSQLSVAKQDSSGVYAASGKNGTWTNSAGVSSTKFAVGNQVFITHIQITYLA